MVYTGLAGQYFSDLDPNSDGPPRAIDPAVRVRKLVSNRNLQRKFSRLRDDDDVARYAGGCIDFSREFPLCNGFHESSIAPLYRKRFLSYKLSWLSRREAIDDKQPSLPFDHVHEANISN